jgi:hypothetical protein
MVIKQAQTVAILLLILLDSLLLLPVFDAILSVGKPPLTCLRSQT